MPSSREARERVKLEKAIELMPIEELRRRFLENALALEAAKKRNQELEGRINLLERLNEEFKNENWDLRIDPRTNLERDLIYFTDLNKEMQQFIDSGKLQRYLSSEKLTTDDLKELDEIPLSVTQADLGYLSKYNEDPEISKFYGEHAGGDAILKETGAVIQRVDKEKQEIRLVLNSQTKGYRVGGDEIAMVHKLKKADAKQVANEFVLKQGKVEIKGDDLGAVVNCGTTSLREAIEAYVLAVPLSERAEKTSEEAAKKLQEMLTSIADRRARLAKGVDRLAAMTRLLATDPKKFERNYRWLQKGAFGMSPREFEELSELLNKEKFPQRIKELVREKLETQTKREEDQRLRERAIIVEIADREL